MYFSVDGGSRVFMTIVVHLADIFAVGKKARGDQFGSVLDQMVPVRNLGELRWYSGCFYERGWENVLLMMSQQTFAEQLADEIPGRVGKEYSAPGRHERC